MKRMVFVTMLCLIVVVSYSFAAEFGPEYGEEVVVNIDGFKPPEGEGIPYPSVYMNPDFDMVVKNLSYTELAISQRSPAWSPDGKWIVFTNANQSLWIVSAEGGEPDILDYQYWGYFNHGVSYTWNEETERWERIPPTAPVEHNVSKSEYVNLSFTPDSRELTYVTNVYDPERGSIGSSNGTSTSYTNFIPTIESIDIYTGERRTVIEEGRQPAWSPDGRYLAFINFDSRIYTDPLQAEYNGALAIYDTATDEVRYPVEFNSSKRYEAEGYMDPSFSPDGSEIVFVYNKQICRIPFEGGEVEQLTNFNTEEAFVNTPKYSPDGQWILFQHNEHLMVFEAETKAVFTIFDGQYVDQSVYDPFPGNNIGKQMMPCWSSDGSKFCYVLLKDPKIGNDQPVKPTYGEYIHIAEFDPDKYVIGKNTPIFVEDSAPSGFDIAGNYPNPFNPSTTIEFSIPVSANTSLTIYNSTGQKVRELVSGELSAGSHSVFWDGRDKYGNFLSSGAYIARLRSGNHVTAKQMMLMK